MSENERKPNTDTDAVVDATDNSTEAAESPAKVEKKPPFCFTDDGCRTDVRVGALLIVAACFLWSFVGPHIAVYLLVLGLPILWVGAVLQARQAVRDQRPGYPWKLALVLTLIGGLMLPDQIYRMTPSGPLGVQMQAPSLLLSGLWLLGCWAWIAYKQSGSSSPSTSPSSTAT